VVTAKAAARQRSALHCLGEDMSDMSDMGHARTFDKSLPRPSPTGMPQVLGKRSYQAGAESASKSWSWLGGW